MTRMTELQRAELSAFLKKHTTLVIATVDREAWPQAASLFYASDDALNLYWVSGEKSRHSQNLERVSRVAVAIHNETWDWRDIHGVQIEINRALYMDERKVEKRPGFDDVARKMTKMLEMLAHGVNSTLYGVAAD